jgi:2-oxoisovalerate dehydrogenase E1 component
MNKALLSLELLYLSRFADEKMSKLVKQNKGSTFYLSTAGHELVGIVFGQNLISKKDWSFPYYRDRAFVISIGSTLIDLFGSFLARNVENHSGGKMMPDHFSHKELKIPCQSSCVGSQFLQAVGVAKGIQNRKSDEVVYVSAGEGATSQGDFHEALNFSSIHKLPIIFVIQDNAWAISVNVQEQTAGGGIEKVASGYTNLDVITVDGCDFERLDEVSKTAINRARSNNGPSLVVAKVPRINSHTISDDHKKYRTDEDIENDKTNDPIIVLEKYLIENDIAHIDLFEQIKIKAKKLIDVAAKEAEKIPFPEKDDQEELVFAKSDVKTKMSENSGEEIVIMDAINSAISEEMEKDKGIVVFGEDVAHGKGGVFGITKNLTDLFGKERCFNTPLAESTIIGLAIGMSFDGFHKPVAEIQFADYTWPAMNQLVNELSSIYYRSNGQWNCPVVIRMPYGGYIQGGPYHSQSIETPLLHSCGLKVVVPSDSANAKLLLKAAIKDPNPVVFLEHKALYRQRQYCARKEPHIDDILEIGKASVINEGADVSVICWGMMVLKVMQAVKLLEKENYSIEVIDLRCLHPLDIDTISKSIEKTSKALIAHEAALFCGFGAEIAAQINEKHFNDLDAPIKRVGGKNCAIPYCQDLENHVLPQVEDLLSSIKDLADY